MILNAFAVLLGFIGLLRLLLGGAVAALAAATLCGRKGSAAPGRSVEEDRYYLLFLLALLLLGLNIVSWPLFYLLLQSYVPQWPDTMCIYGVLQVGTGSQGPSGYLPAILKALQATKPILILGTGAWFALYLLNRQTRTAPLMGRVLAVLMPLGVFAVADASLELGYLAIPKKEDFLSVGCCSVVGRPADANQALRFGPDPTVLSVFFWSAHAGLLAIEFVSSRRKTWESAKRWLMPALIADLVCLPLAGFYLVHVAAPQIMRLPYHHCPYDLLERAPESALAVALYVGGTLSTLWGCAAGWGGDVPETRPAIASQVRRWLSVALYGHVASLAMISVALTLH